MVGIMMVKKQTASHWWWLDSHSNTKRSPWLQSTLSELDEKTEAMLKLIEEDADSFAKRAEMYYKKRPELIGMVEDFYRAHRSLAERYDQIKSETPTRLLSSLGSPFSGEKFRQEKSVMANVTDRINYDSYSETFDHDENAESEVEDPDEDDVHEFQNYQNALLNSHNVQISESARSYQNALQYAQNNQNFGNAHQSAQNAQIFQNVKSLNTQKNPQNAENAQTFQNAQITQKSENAHESAQISKSALNAKNEGEVRKLREEIERLKEELEKKDEEKREVIRQLSLAVGMLKEENLSLKKLSAIKEGGKKKESFEVKTNGNNNNNNSNNNKGKGGFFKNLFNGSFLSSQATVVAL